MARAQHPHSFAHGQAAVAPALRTARAAEPRNAGELVEAFVLGRARAGFSSFSLNELVGKTALTLTVAERELEQMSTRVARISRADAYYVITGRNTSSCPLHVLAWLDDYLAWAGVAYYIGHQTAAALHGASGRIKEILVVTDQPRKALRFCGVKILFVAKSGAAGTPMEDLGVDKAPVMVSTAEATAMDLVRQAGEMGGMVGVAKIVRGLIPKLRPEQMHCALVKAGDKSLARRLASLFASFGATDLEHACEDAMPVEIDLSSRLTLRRLALAA